MANHEKIVACRQAHPNHVFKSVVIDGARKANVMASFARFLNAADAEDLRAYILKEAHNAQADAAAAKVASAK